LQKILEIIDDRKKEYLSEISEKRVQNDEHRVILDFYDEIFKIYLDEFIKNL